MSCFCLWENWKPNQIEYDFILAAVGLMYGEGNWLWCWNKPQCSNARNSLNSHVVQLNPTRLEHVFTCSNMFIIWRLLVKLTTKGLQVSGQWIPKSASPNWGEEKENHDNLHFNFPIFAGWTRHEYVLLKVDYMNCQFIFKFKVSEHESDFGAKPLEKPSVCDRPKRLILPLSHPPW